MAEAPGLQLVGASHRSAPAELRQRITLDETRRDELYARLGSLQEISEVVVLSTCNRVELYAVASTGEASHALRAHYCAVTGLEPATLPEHGFAHAGEAVARHLMEVCSGLDSQMVGEPEILGQVKQAYALASSRGTAGPVMHRLFQKAFQAAKLVRTQSSIGTGQLSLGNIAVDLARRIYGDLGRSRVLVVGSGKVGAAVARSLKKRGAQSLVVTSRTAGRSDKLAAEVQGQAIPFADFPARVPESDIIVCCTAAPGLVLTREVVAHAMARRPGRPLFLIDLAVPRDIEPAAAKVANTFLYNFDDLAVLSNENLKGRMSEIDDCRRVLAERAARLWEDICAPREGARSAG